MASHNGGAGSYLVQKSVERHVSEMKMISGLDEEGAEKSNLPPLHYAAWYNKQEAVEMLLKMGAGK